MADTSFDLIVVGGGPGGYVAAIRAAQLGMKTARRRARASGRHLPELGLHPDQGAAALGGGRPPAAARRRLRLQRQGRQLRPRRRSSSARARSPASSSRGVGYLLKKNKVTVFDGHGQARRHRQARRSRRTASRSPTSPAKNIILATGARARALPGLEPDGKLVWTYKEAMVPAAMPKSLLVVGSGAIGIEFASFYRDLGAEVTVVEVLDRILPVEDEEISAFAHKAFEKQGMKIMTGATVKALKKGTDNVTATIEAGGKTPGDHRRPRHPRRRHRRQCRESRPRRHQGEGREDPCRDRQLGRTGEPGVYAIGDRRRPALAGAQGQP